MVPNLSPSLEATNSLLMNNPIGCEYWRPLGAVNDSIRSDMMRELWKSRLLLRAKKRRLQVDGGGRLRTRRTQEREDQTRMGWLFFYIQDNRQ